MGLIEGLLGSVFFILYLAVVLVIPIIIAVWLFKSIGRLNDSVAGIHAELRRVADALDADNRRL